MKAQLVNNTTVEIEFDNEKQREILAKQLSYKIPGYQHTVAYKTGKWKEGTKCYLTAKNRLKIGLFKSLFPNHSLVFDKTFTPITFEDIPLYQTNPSFERRNYQLNAINTILQNKIMIVKATMGAGKTLISAATLSYHLSLTKSNKALFITYDKNILTQTVKNFTKYGFKVSQFGDGVKDLSGDVVVSTIQSLNNILKPKEVLKNVSFVILDEVHHGKSKTSRKIISKIPNADYFIGLTATPHEKRDIDNADLTSIVGPVLFEYGFTEATKDERIAPVKAFFLDLPTDYDLKEEIFGRKNYKLIWDKGVQENTGRNETIAKILSYCIELLDTPNLVLVDRIEHGLELCNAMKKEPAVKYMTMYGADDIVMRDAKKKALMTENINTLISTVISEGIDFAISPVFAINASGRKSFIKLIQFLGRITRPNEKFKSFRCYVDIIDRTHPFLLYHSNERIKTCEEFGIEVEICKSVKELLVEIIKYYKQCTKEKNEPQ